jgi:DNA polymerase-3 subunit beta
MKFSVSSVELQRNLANIGGVIPQKSTLPILENFYFDVDGDTLSITATDLEISMTVHLKVKGATNGKVVIPAKRLLETIRALPSTDVGFKADLNTHKIEMTTQNGQYRLTGESTENYPTIPEFTGQNELVLSSDELHRLIGKTEFAVSKDELRPAMNGVLLQIGKKELRAVATDGHRLVQFTNKSFSSAKEADVIIPVKALGLVAKCLDGDSKVLFNDTHIMFSLGNITLISRIIEEKYPNYESVIPLDNEKKLVVDKNQILSSVRRAALYASSTTHLVRFSLSKGSITISAEDIDFGSEARETLSCEFSSEAMEIGFNAGYMLDILSHIDTDEALFLFSTSSRAAIVKPVAQKEGEEIGRAHV